MCSGTSDVNGTFSARSSLGGPDYGHHQPQQQQHHPSYNFGDDYPAPSHGYKTYVMSSAPKYQSVFGAIKSLFGGGPMMSDAAPSSTHVSPYSAPSGPSYYSSSAMHHPPASFPSSSAMSSGSPGYYFGSR